MKIALLAFFAIGVLCLTGCQPEVSPEQPADVKAAKDGAAAAPAKGADTAGKAAEGAAAGGAPPAGQPPLPPGLAGAAPIGQAAPDEPTRER